MEHCLVLVGGKCAGEMVDVPVHMKTFRAEKVELSTTADVAFDAVNEPTEVVWDDYALVEVRTGPDTWNMIRFGRHIEMSDSSALSELLRSYLKPSIGAYCLPPSAHHRPEDKPD